MTARVRLHLSQIALPECGRGGEALVAPPWHVAQGESGVAAIAQQAEDLRLREDAENPRDVKQMVGRLLPAARLPLLERIEVEDRCQHVAGCPMPAEVLPDLLGLEVQLGEARPAAERPHQQNIAAPAQ